MEKVSLNWPLEATVLEPLRPLSPEIYELEDLDVTFDKLSRSEIAGKLLDHLELRKDAEGIKISVILGISCLLSNVWRMKICSKMRRLGIANLIRVYVRHHWRVMRHSNETSDRNLMFCAEENFVMLVRSKINISVSLKRNTERVRSLIVVSSLEVVCIRVRLMFLTSAVPTDIGL